jgi:hypothetical protein
MLTAKFQFIWLRSFRGEDYNVKKKEKKKEMIIANIFSFSSFLAHLAKGKVSFCHHLASVVRRPLTFHILIFSAK